MPQTPESNKVLLTLGGCKHFVPARRSQFLSVSSGAATAAHDGAVGGLLQLLQLRPNLIVSTYIR